MPELKARLTEEEMQRFAETAVKRGRMTHQSALKDAIEFWTAYRDSGTVPPTGGNSVITDKGVHLVLNHELRGWLVLVKRALTVRDAAWVSMLRSIRHQLEIVADKAEADGTQDHPQPNTRRRIKGALPDGKRDPDPTHGHNT